MKNRIDGINPLDNQSAAAAYGRTLFYLQKIIVADLKMCRSDDRLDRAIMGAVVAIRVLLEEHEMFATSCHSEDFQEWKSQYLEWFDKNSAKIARKKGTRDEMRRLAESEFDRIIRLCCGKGVFRFSETIRNSPDKTADLRYFGPDGRLVKVPKIER